MSDKKESRFMYEAPAIEVVLAPEDVEREVLYAGRITTAK